MFLRQLRGLLCLIFSHMHVCQVDEHQIYIENSLSKKSKYFSELKANISRLVLNLGQFKSTDFVDFAFETILFVL